MIKQLCISGVILLTAANVLALDATCAINVNKLAVAGTDLSSFKTTNDDINVCLNNAACAATANANICKRNLAQLDFNTYLNASKANDMFSQNSFAQANYPTQPQNTAPTTQATATANRFMQNNTAATNNAAPQTTAQPKTTKKFNWF